MTDRAGLDDRLKKPDGASRENRSSADVERENKDGTSTTMAERKRMLREQMVNEVLPDPNNPKVPGWHYCWLSTTNQSDPIYKRLSLGYELVKASDMPKFSLQNKAMSGEFEGCIAINEMILSRIPEELYQEILMINHHEKPMEEEAFLKANAAPSQQDSHGNALGMREGFETLGRRVAAPTF